MLDEIQNRGLISKKYKSHFMALNYIEQVQILMLVSAITGCVSNSASVLLVGIPIGTVSSVERLKCFPITAIIKKIQANN